MNGAELFEVLVEAAPCEELRAQHLCQHGGVGVGGGLGVEEFCDDPVLREDIPEAAARGEDF